MHLKRVIITLVPALGILFGACTSSDHHSSHSPGFVQGKATVLQVDNTLGIATLKVDGKQVPAYWDSDIVVPFHVDSVDSHDPVTGPTRSMDPSKKEIEPVTRHVELPAKPGDTIEFRGMMTRNELLLRYVQVVAN